VSNPNGSFDACYGVSNAHEEMQAVHYCLEQAGFAGDMGTADGKKGFTEALCRCNEDVFKRDFVCDQISRKEFNLGDLALLEEIADECIIIMTLELFIPLDPQTPHIGSLTNRAVTVTGASLNPPSIKLSDPNDPDVTLTFPVKPDGTISEFSELPDTKHRLKGGAAPHWIERITIKCESSESAEAAALSQIE